MNGHHVAARQDGESSARAARNSSEESGLAGPEIPAANVAVGGARGDVVSRKKSEPLDGSVVTAERPRRARGDVDHDDAAVRASRNEAPSAAIEGEALRRLDGGKFHGDASAWPLANL